MNHLRASQQGIDKGAYRYEGTSLWIYGMRTNKAVKSVSQDSFLELDIKDVRRYGDWKPLDSTRASIFAKIFCPKTVDSPTINKAPMILRS